MTTAIYAGSFDPITNGHIDILKAGVETFDKVIIAVAYNPDKKCFLPVETRVDLIKKCVKDFTNVEVDSYNGLTVDYARKNGATVLLRGVRNSQDFEYETQLAQINKALANEINTVFINAKPEHSFISSSAVKEILANKGDISQLVPKCVNDYLNMIFG